MPQFNPDGSLLRRQQLRQIDILLAVDAVCRRHGLDYWLSSGTLLGAVRHGGFIPWDDDVDIEMPIGHYRRLLTILPDELPPRFVLQTPHTDPGYFYTYAKVRDTRSRLREVAGYDSLFAMQGLYIDIFPVERTHRLLHWISRRTHGRTYVAFKRGGGRKEVRRILHFNLRFVFPLLRALARVLPCRTYCGLGVPFSPPRPMHTIYPLGKIMFEGHSLSAPRDCDAYLRHFYGDYMRWPDLTKLTQHTSNVEIEE